MFTLIVAASFGQCYAPGAAAATYSRSTNYVAPVHHVANFVGFVSIDPYHSTVGAAARVEAKAAADAQVTADLAAQVAALTAALTGQAGPQPAPTAPANTPAFASVITASCVSCHNPAKQSGGMVFGDDKGQLLDVDSETKLVMLESVADGRMPKNKDKGSPVVKRALADWIKSDSDKLLAAIKETK